MGIPQSWSWALSAVESRPLQTRKLIIFTALRFESRAIRQALSNNNKQNTELYTIGIRGRHIPIQLPADQNAVLIMAGFGGALEPTLAVGDIVLDDALHLVPASVSVRRGPILTTDHIITTPSEKAELFKKTNALAVDMEGSVVREFARRLNIPFISVRAISDMADEVLDPAVVGFVDDFGRVRPISLATGLLRRPNLIPYLNRLGKNSKLAAEQLGLAVRKIVDALTGG
jgi:hypothetical protein